MKEIGSSLSVARNKIISWFHPKYSEYKLARSDIPDLYKIKKAHYDLLQRYVEALAAVSRLSFFVGMNEVNPPKEGWISRILRFIVWGKFSPFRVLVWRPVIKLYVDTHIYKKLAELEKVYAQTAYLIPSQHHEKSDYTAWLHTAKEDCEKLRLTLKANDFFLRATRYLFLVVIGLATAIWGAGNIFDLIIKMTSAPPPTIGLVLLGRFIVLTVLAFPFLLAFLDAAFAAKRAIFLSTSQTPQQPVYELENNLYTLLNRGKSREFPIDYSIAVFFYSMIIGYLWLIHWAISQLPRPNNGIFIDCTWCLLIPYVFLFFMDVVVPWWRRESQEEL